MTGEWTLIARGLAIAALGASATACYIVGISYLYVGRSFFGIGALVMATLGAVLFRTCLGPYLDALDNRAQIGETDSTSVPAQRD